MNLRTFLSAIMVPRVCARAGCGDAAPCQDWRCWRQSHEVESRLHVLGPEEHCRRDYSSACDSRRKDLVDIVEYRPFQNKCEFVARRVLALLSEIGYLYGDVIIKSDLELTLTSLVEGVGRRRAAAGGGRWICENSPVGSSASNGVAERAIQSVQQQVRVLKLALENM